MRPPSRPTAFRRRAGVLALALLSLLAVGCAHAQQISYTVQVVALSDPDSAFDVQRDLLRQGYPAYVVRSTSSQGAVYRVRVGAFANRPAALLYSEAMPEVAGGQPVPALAEGIPGGITPLSPLLVFSQDLTGLDARVIRMGEHLALRTQQRTPLEPADHAIFTDAGVERVRAWQLSVADDGTRVVVREMPLWPDTWENETSEVLEGYQASVITLVAERLDLDPATVRAARYGVTTGVPRLIVVERVVEGAVEGPELLGLGLPASGMTPTGPLQFLGVEAGALPGLPEGVRIDLAAGTATGALLARPGSAGEETAPEGEDVPPAEPEGEPETGSEPETDPAGAPETTTEPEAAPEPAPEPEAASEVAPEPEAEREESGEPSQERSDAGVEPSAQPTEGSGAGGPVIAGEGWFAEADGPFVRLTLVTRQEGAAAQSWRAAFGTPLWSSDGYLLAHVGKTLLVYEFLPRD